MSLNKSLQFSALSEKFAIRRVAILDAWRKIERADPDQTTGRSLTVSQFYDHIPEILDAFEYRLRSRPGGIDAQTANEDKKLEGVQHGLHRWQQGYRLQELINECGHLQICLFNELEKIVAESPEFDREVLVETNRQIMELVNDMISESAGQYERMQQAESAGHVGDLMSALASVNEIERRRATLIHQAVHDLNSDVAGVSLAANLMSRSEIAQADRTEFATILKRSVSGLSVMLGDLMELARLEAGQDIRSIAPFDAAAVITERCSRNEPFADERQLFLEVDGPASLEVEGDAEKVGRLLQNLLTNALKYTPAGGVAVTWGPEKENWWLMVKDTGPGLHSRAISPLVTGLKEATQSAKEADDNSADKDEGSNVLAQRGDATGQFHPHPHLPGEGIGLSIVKRLCELLDASLEVASSADTGTTFRVVFPRRYRSAPPSPAR